VYGALGSIPLAFGLSLVGLRRNSYRAYGIAGTIISGAAAVLVIGLLGAGLVVSMCS